MKTGSGIQHLRVMHWPRSTDEIVTPDSVPGCFVVDTCLRRLNIWMAASNPPPALSYGPLHTKLRSEAEYRTGIDAYAFLLEIATGLRSAIPGETNVFGQFKRAWLEIQGTRSTLRLKPIVRQLFADTKKIRQRYLEGIGGSSYGGLVRKLVAAYRSDRILFVGAGALARSMLPWFERHRTGLWNRSELDALPASVERVFRRDQGLQAATWADHVILCTPPDSGHDARWRAWTIAGAPETVVYLGHSDTARRPDENQSWAHVPRFYDLFDVYSLRAEQDGLRARQLQRARSACRKYALAAFFAAGRDFENHATLNPLVAELTTCDPGLAVA